MNEAPKIYTEHRGTVRVSGQTLPSTAAGCAYGYIQEGLSVEFFFIGANAGHQATKAMTILAYIIKNEMEGKAIVAFEPSRVLTMAKDSEGILKEKDATVWRALIIKQ